LRSLEAVSVLGWATLYGWQMAYLRAV